MPKRRLREAVIDPQTAPEMIATRVASQGSPSWEMIAAATAAPVEKLPSTVRSGKSSTRKLR